LPTFIDGSERFRRGYIISQQEAIKRGHALANIAAGVFLGASIAFVSNR